MLFDYFLVTMNNLSVLRATLKQKLQTHIMKTKTTQSKQVSITLDKVCGLVADTWNNIRSSKLTIKIEPI
ncbi:MAG: hypothetical protein IIA20_01400 [Thaumarchaeota archaeon]|nr:hypothetical protein [Nitrososphaerota archaeon]